MSLHSSVPVIIVETLARFSFPFLSMLISQTFMPKKTRETNIEGREGSNTCVHETNKFMLCFPEVFQQIMTAIVARARLDDDDEQ